MVERLMILPTNTSAVHCRFNPCERHASPANHEATPVRMVATTGVQFMKLHITNLFACTLVFHLFGVVSLADPPQFTHAKNKTSISIQEFKASAELEFVGKKPKNEYTVEFKSLIGLPSKLDLVCVTDELKIASAIDDKKKSLMPTRSLRRSSSRSSNDDFNAFHGGSADSELKAAELAANPYRVKEMVISATAILARKRAEVIIDATVEEDFDAIGHSMRVRLSSMKIDRSRVAEISLDYKRPKGRIAPFLEAVYALDANGNELGGGRWSKGMGIFSDSMQFKGEFAIARTANIDKFKLIILTEYEIYPLEFTIKDVFQQ